MLCPLDMLKPLAVIYYERLLPGSQLANRLQDMGYRVQTASDLSALPNLVGQENPMILLIDAGGRAELKPAISQIKNTPHTTHLPIIAFAPEENHPNLAAARSAGAEYTAIDSGLVSHLANWLERALAIE